MKTGALFLSLCAALCLALGGAAFASSDAQESKSQLIVPLRSGAFVQITTEAVPPGSPEVSLSFIESEDKPNLIHRVFVDGKDELYFGYELLVEPVAATRQFRVTVRPLSAEYEQALRARRAFQNRRLHPSYNASAFDATPQLIGDGDTFALDVLHNPRTGTKIVDVVTVSLEDPRFQQARATEGPPRDFSLADVSLKVTNYKLLVNGETAWSSSGGCSGPLVWFSLADRGRFVFSLTPRPGYDFKKVGTVEHNKISFEWGDDRYEWVSALPVVGTGGNWSLWVLHDPGYSFDLYNKPDADASEQATVGQSIRRARRQQSGRAEFGTPGESSQPARTKRVRVAIGAADEVERLLPKKQEP
ncbi:MAG TPA: hypothetical protein VFS10_00860 [Pyrinomonadaceae bacterium]|nr:hypothetical protein [Pyrinomonadaceae bacterium]